MFFGEYLPDLPARDNTVTDGKNLIPHGKSYKSVGSLTALSDALTHRPQGAISVKNAAGNSFTYVGDKTTLYVLSADAFSSANLSVVDTDISFTASATIDTVANDFSVFADGQKVDVSGTSNNDASWDTGTGHTISGTPTTTTITTTGSPAIVNESAGTSFTVKRMYSTATDSHWEFTQWGTKVIAVNGADEPQVATIGAASNQFDDLGGSPPIAKHITNVRDFVVLGNLSGNPNKIHWSAINNEASWTVGTNQSDTQTFQTGGHVQKIVGGEYGTVFCETAIYRMNYVGEPYIFTFDEVERDRGTPAPQSVVNLGETIWYLGIDGFYAFNGSQSVNIGSNKVDKSFYSDVDQNYFDRIWGAVDPINSIVFWAYPGSGNTAGRCNRIVAYNYTLNRWGPPIEAEVDLIFNGLSEGVTLDGLSALYSSLDAIPFSLDSRVWMGGSTILSAFDENKKLATFTGAALDGRLVTGEYRLTPNGNSMLNGVAPLFDGSGTATIKVGTRNDVNGSVTWTSAISVTSATGIADFREDARYHTIDLTISGGFTHLYGADLDFTYSGNQ